MKTISSRWVSTWLSVALLKGLYKYKFQSVKHAVKFLDSERVKSDERPD
jgi:hypothetical protein